MQILPVPHRRLRKAILPLCLPRLPKNLKIRRGIQPQGVQIPLKTPLLPLQTRLSLATPPPPCHGGWPSPARPSRMKFQPRPRFEALAVRAQFAFKIVFCWRSWTPRRSLEAPGGRWRPLEAEARTILESCGKTPPRNLYRP